MVGTPCIASYAGGMMDSVSDGETGFLYRFEETEMLAMLVCRLFGDMDLCRRLSFRGMAGLSGAPWTGPRMRNN